LFSPAGLVVNPAGNFLYVAGTLNSDSSVSTLPTDPISPSTPTGDGPSSFGQQAKYVAIDPQGRFLFVGRGQTRGLIDTYLIPPGGLPGYAGSTFDTNTNQDFPRAMAVDATGMYLYVEFAVSGLRGFVIEQSTGALTELPASPFSPPGSGLLISDPAAQFIYADRNAFKIDATGALNPISGSPLAVPDTATGVAAANPLDPVQPISAPQLTLAPSPLQFSEQFVGASSQLQISLSYTGTASPILSSISLTGINKDDFSQSNCPAPAVLQPGNGCTILITFQPTAEGLRQATLTVVDNAIGPHTVELTGTGRQPFTIQIDSSMDSVVAGQTAQYNLQLVPALGFVGQVMLACAGAPAGAVCNVPPSVQLDGSTPALFAVSVPTTARSAVPPLARRPPPGVGNESSRRLLIWGALLALLLWMLPRPRPALAAVLWAQPRIRCTILLLLVCVSLSLVSCAGVAGPATSNPAGSASSTGTPAGVYTLTLTASSGGAAQTRSLTLEVQ